MKSKNETIMSFSEVAGPMMASRMVARDSRVRKGWRSKGLKS